jgi:hypothetical protein
MVAPVCAERIAALIKNASRHHRRLAAAQFRIEPNYIGKVAVSRLVQLFVKKAVPLSKSASIAGVAAGNPEPGNCSLSSSTKPTGSFFTGIAKLRF